MSMFERPGSMAAVKEWNKARSQREKAEKKYRNARDALWLAKVRMARAHKRAQEAVGPDHEHLIKWFPWDGDRDRIIAAELDSEQGE